MADSFIVNHMNKLVTDLIQIISSNEKSFVILFIGKNFFNTVLIGLIQQWITDIGTFAERIYDV